MHTEIGGGVIVTSTSVSGYTTKSGKKVAGYTQQRTGGGTLPKRKPSQRQRRAVGGGIAGASAVTFLSSAFNFGSSAFNFGAALFTVAGMSVLAWGGNRYRKKRKGRKKTNQLGLPIAGRGRPRTPAQIRAAGAVKREKKQLKHDLRKDWVASLFGPSRLTKSDWSKP
jgi:hypothetical protein